MRKLQKYFLKIMIMWQHLKQFMFNLVLKSISTIEEYFLIFIGVKNNSLITKKFKNKLFFLIFFLIIYIGVIIFISLNFLLPLIYSLGFVLIPSFISFILIFFLLVYSEYHFYETPLFYFICLSLYSLFGFLYLIFFFKRNFLDFNDLVSVINFDLLSTGYFIEYAFLDFFVMSPVILFSNILILFFSFLLIYLYIYINKSFNNIKENMNYIIMVYFLIFGLSLLLSSNNYMVLYLSLEIVSFILYIMIGMENKQIFSIEASLKYFIFNALASGIFLFLLVVLFYNYGSLNYLNIESASILLEYNWCQITSNYIIFFDRLFIIQLFIGIIFFFKLGLAPLHFWLPDVYEGSSLITLVFMAVVVKIGYFITYLRFIETIPSIIFDKYVILIYIFSISSILLGSFGALRQKSLKRFLSYTSITNLGYIILCTSFDTVLSFWYFIIYIILNFIFFSGIIVLSKQFSLVFIEDISKLNRNFFLIFFLFLFAALPPSPLFFLKSLLLLYLYESLSFLTIMCIMCSSLISVYYYLKLIKILIIQDNNIYQLRKYKL